MKHQYTITETHGNRDADDLSSVYLHDVIVRSVRYEAGDFILLTEGFTVRPQCTPNDTDRYLQTGESEIRIMNTEIPDGYPMEDTDYDILAHEYNCRFRIFKLSILVEGRPVWFHFRCSKVEYRFSEFTGDSWLQQYRDRERRELKSRIEKGHGYAYEMLKRLPPYICEEYTDLLLHAAAHDLRLDHQCDEMRGRYVTELISLLPEDGKTLIDRLMQNEWRNCVNPAINPDDFSHCVDMILENQEHPMAEETIAYLETRLTEMLAGMTDVSTEEYAWTVRKLEALRWQVYKIIPESDQPGDWPRPAEPEYTMDSIIQFCLTSEKSVHPARFRNYFEKDCTADNINRLLQAARNESNPVLRRRLYSMFAKVDFPADPAELIAEARSAETELSGDYPGYITAMNLQRAVSRLHHPSVTAYRDELIAKAESAEEKMRSGLLGYAVDHWVSNFHDTEEENEAFADLLNSFPEDPDGLRHHAALSITYSEMYKEPFEDSRAYRHLYWIISDTYCPNCRRKAFEILHQHGRMNARTARICLHDCDSRIRELAEDVLK